MNKFSKVLTIFLFASLIMSGVFGLMLMHMNGDHSFGCMAARQNIACPLAIRPFDQLAIHIKFFQSYSTAIISSVVLSLIVLFAAFVSILAAEDTDLLSSLARVFSGEPRHFSYQPGLLSWIALHEKRDFAARIA